MKIFLNTPTKIRKNFNNIVVFLVKFWAQTLSVCTTSTEIISVSSVPLKEHSWQLVALFKALCEVRLRRPAAKLYQICHQGCWVRVRYFGLLNTAACFWGPTFSSTNLQTNSPPSSNLSANLWMFEVERKELRWLLFGTKNTHTTCWDTRVIASPQRFIGLQTTDESD